MKVSTEYRKNVKSKIAGGVTVVVKYKNGSTHEYDNIKNADKYINAVLNNDVAEEAWVKGENEIVDNQVIGTL